MVNPAALNALIEGDIDNFIAASTPGGIERQEAAGQQELVNGTNFPIDMSPNREAFEKMGFVFGQQVDDIFFSAKLPAGWKKEATDHSMWSYITDAQGRKRAAIFYKAAFYDRRARATLERRYIVQMVYPDMGLGAGLKEDEGFIALVDGGQTILQRSEVFKRDNYEVCDPIDKGFRKALDELYPEHRDPTAYWND